MAAKLMVQILGESSSAVSAFKKTEVASKEATTSAKGTTKSLAGIAAGVATGLAVQKVVQFGKATVDAAGAAAKANKTLIAVFKNAGDETGKWSKHAIELASSLGRTTGVSPTLIKSAQAILGTFHNLSGETGQTSGMFDRATKAAADLASAGFGDMEGNAKMLGKAMQDPVKGLTALTRSGVTFTQQQKDQIKAMTAGTASASELAAAHLKVEESQSAYNQAVAKYGPDSLQAQKAAVKLDSAQKGLNKTQSQGNDILGAQKLIMKEVENQVGGVAAKTAGSGAKMKVAMEELKVSIGTALLPIISKLRTELTKLIDFVNANSAWLLPLIAGIAAFVAVALTISKVIRVIDDVKKAVEGFGKAWKALNSSFLMSPIGLIIAGIVVLIVVIVLIATKTDWFQRLWRNMTKMWAATANALTSAWGAVASFFVGIWDAIVAAAQAAWNWIKSNWPLLVGVLFGPFGIVVSLIITHWAQVTSFLSTAWSAVWSVIGGVVMAVWGVIDGIWQGMVAAWNAIVGMFAGVWNIAWLAISTYVQVYIAVIVGIFNVLTAAWNAVTSLIASVWNAVWGAATAVIGAAAGTIMSIFGGVLSFFSSVPGIIGGALASVASIISTPFVAAWSVIYSGIISPLSSAFSGVVGAIRSALSGVTDAITAPFLAAWHIIQSTVIGPLKSAWNGIAHAINAVHIKIDIPDAIPGLPPDFTFDPPDVPTLARGGLLTRTGLVLAHAGEVVSPVPARLSRRSDGPLVRIEHAHFDEKVDVDTFGRRLAWQVATAGV